tara:strand:- start:2084 stop:3436 length:1353 start_codon:yes stop_codon:yes gene_type:complete
MASRIPGPLPTSHPNRPFWNDKFVEPKQQHRFAVNFPVYMPGKNAVESKYNDTIELATEIIGAESGFGSTYAAFAAAEFPNRALERNKDLIKSENFDQADIILSGLLSSAYPKPKEREVQINKVMANKRNDVPDYSNTINTALSSNKFQHGPQRLVYRISEYIGFSFAPPAFGFKPGIANYKDGTGQELIDPSKNSFTIGDATITVATTLRDDLHFSLNLLYSLTAIASKDSSMIGSSTGGHQVFLYHPGIFKDAQENKVLVVKEFAPRPMHGENGLQGTSNVVVGLHKLHDPVIKGVQYTEYTYGGTEIIKATITLGWGPNTGMTGFYSYQPTMNFTNARLSTNNDYTRHTGDGIKSPQDIEQAGLAKAQNTQNVKRAEFTKARAAALHDAAKERFTPPPTEGSSVLAGHLVSAVDPAQQGITTSASIRAGLRAATTGTDDVFSDDGSP